MAAERAHVALDLVDQWYTAHHSVALLPVAAERYESMQRPELVRFARQKLQEEAGHHQLPLNDLRALGYDPEAAVKEVPPGPIARALVQYARDCVHGPEPVAFFGYIFALERRVIRITDDALRTLGSALPNGVEATSGVRAHAVEFDHQHVEEMVAFVSALPADDRTGGGAGLLRHGRAHLQTRANQ
jgi:pyrroloquinoline quinone (PQQ) biosynthesis protein C